MKIWIKITAGIILGAILGAILKSGPVALEVCGFLSRLFIQIGRYVVFPLIFFSLGMGTYELRRDKQILAVYGKILLYLVASTLLMVLIGLLTVLIFSPERIPIIVEKEEAFRMPGIQETLLAIFPTNLFQVLLGPGELLLPLIVLAFIIGVNLNFDLRITSPVIQLFDSLNRIFYHINTLVVELFGFAMITVTAFFILNIKRYDLGLFKQVLLILSLDFFLVVFGVFPGILYLLGDRENPYRWLYAVIGPVLAAFFTGDGFLGVGMLVKHGKESLGVPRRLGSAVYPLFAFFGRAGSALVASASFMLVLKSYSSLEISFFQILWTLGFSLLVSLCLGAVPGAGAFAAVSALCTVFGRGMQEGYLILKPIAPLLVSFGVSLDVLTSAFVSLIVARKTEMWEKVEAHNFV